MRTTKAGQSVPVTTNGGGATVATTGATDRPGPPVFTPPVDVYETEQDYIVYADIPGAQASEIDVRFADGDLSIHAPAPTRQPTGAAPLLTEYGVGPYHRVFRLGEGVDASAVSADHRDGVLTLRLPKSHSAQPRRIQVQTR